MNNANLTTSQLLKIDSAIDIFMFSEGGKEEGWAASYSKDPGAFKKLLTSMSTYKQDVMRYFRAQYANRFNLIRMHVVRADEGDPDDEEDSDQYDNSFYTVPWQQDNQTLAGILENNNSIGFGLGISALAYSSGRQVNLTPQDYQSQITDRAVDMAAKINETTKKRGYAAIQASLELGEDRAALDARLKDIFVAPYRGMLIAQNELLTAYLDGKHEAAYYEGYRFKTWLTMLATDIVCGDVSNETVGIDENFSNGLDGPLAHFNCRCDLEYS